MHRVGLHLPLCSFELQEEMAVIGRLQYPFPLFAYPFYLWNRSPGKQGSHYDPKSDLFVPAEAKQVRT